MENTGPESPVIVHTSPVSSPVFVNSYENDENDNDNNNTEKANSNNEKNIELVELLETKVSLNDGLKLPPLDESLIKVQVDNTPHVDPKPATQASESESNVHNKASTNVVQSQTTENSSKNSASELVKDFKYCHEEFHRQIANGNYTVSPETIMKLLRIAMTIVEQTKETGPNKKIFVINLLRDLFVNDKTGMLGEHKMEALNLIYGNVVSDAIDFIIDASKGKLDVNKIEVVAETVATSCFSHCLSRIFKRS
jgi:anti-sigma28 factor (negative regulator of flagellin synthesis)